MRKAIRALPLLFLILVFLAGNISCKKFLKNLSANSSFKEGNSYYKEEKFNKARKAYLLALRVTEKNTDDKLILKDGKQVNKDGIALDGIGSGDDPKAFVDTIDKISVGNPGLPQAYKYLGTSCATLYNAGDQSPENMQLEKESVEFLQLAQKYEPENKDVILALGQLHDKMDHFKEAEDQYLKVLDAARRKYEASHKDQEKIELADLYVVMADFYKKYIGKVDFVEEKVMDMYNQRIALNPDDPDAYLFPAKYFFDRKKWDDSEKYHEQRLAKIEQSTSLDAEKKNEKLAEAYYRIGHLNWAHSYQTPVDMMSRDERQQVIDKGMKALDNAIERNPTYADPYVYKGLLWLELDKIDPANHDKHQEERDKLVKKYQDLVKVRRSTEQYMKELEKGD